MAGTVPLQCAADLAPRVASAKRVTETGGGGGGGDVSAYLDSGSRGGERRGGCAVVFTDGFQDSGACIIVFLWLQRSEGALGFIG